jgi:hypothetical protein
VANRYLSRAEKAKQLKISRQRLHAMEKSGIISPVAYIGNISGFNEEQQPTKKDRKTKT